MISNYKNDSQGLWQRKKRIEPILKNLNYHLKIYFGHYSQCLCRIGKANSYQLFNRYYILDIFF